MKTPIDFEYDLWTEEKGTGLRYWVRIKKTGETAEVSHDVMKLLRAEEKRMRRAADPKEESVLSLDAGPSEEGGWLRDRTDPEDAVLQKICTEQFRKILTPIQAEVFDRCMLEGRTVTEFAEAHGISHQAVSKHLSYIRKKAKNFF